MGSINQTLQIFSPGFLKDMGANQHAAAIGQLYIQEPEHSALELEKIAISNMCTIDGQLCDCQKD